MKFVDEFRDPAHVRSLVAEIERATKSPWKIMEVCGGQTHTIARYALEELVPDLIEIVHGPGCPVCVTPLAVIDAARNVSIEHGAILCSYGDMLRVPGAGGDLLDARAHGGDVRIVQSPLEAIEIARQTPGRQVVFFAVGFETTAPATAMAAIVARDSGLKNFTVLCAHVRVPPAMDAILSAPDCDIDGFLAAGHVCTVVGTSEYEPLCARHQVPIVVTGFEPVDILYGLLDCVRQLEAGRAELENRYPRSVAAEGNPAARDALDRVFCVADRPWRGFGVIPGGALVLRPEYADFDAFARFEISLAEDEPATRCRASEILAGRLKPEACPEFGRACTPESPIGAPMVSTEGACAAYYRYRRVRR